MCPKRHIYLNTLQEILLHFKQAIADISNIKMNTETLLQDCKNWHRNKQI